MQYYVKSQEKNHILVFKWSHLVENLCQSGVLLKIDLKETEKFFSFLSIVSEDQHGILKPNTYEFLPNHHCHGQKKIKTAAYCHGSLQVINLESWDGSQMQFYRAGMEISFKFRVKHCVIFIVIVKYELIELNDSKYKLLYTI